jgi:hypothetical protein
MERVVPAWEDGGGDDRCERDEVDGLVTEV